MKYTSVAFVANRRFLLPDRLLEAEYPAALQNLAFGSEFKFKVVHGLKILSVLTSRTSRPWSTLLYLSAK